MARLPEYNIYIDKEKIGTVKGSTLNIKRSSMYFKYYLERGNKYYFRNNTSKLMIETEDIMPLKYGDEIKAEW